MTRPGYFVPSALVVCACIALAPHSAAQTVEDLQKKIDELTLRVEALEKERAARPEAAPRAAAALNQGQQEARALYDTIDALLAEGKIEAAKQQLTDFNQKYAGTSAGAWTRSLAREMEVVGKPAPSSWFIEKWYQGKSDVKLNGSEPTLLIFWESWCPHCRRAVPKFQKIHEENRDKGLQVVGITRLTRDATEESVKSFISENSLSYPMAKETGDLATYFNVKGIPAAAVVKDGTIIWRGHPQRLTSEMLAGWL